MRKYLAIGFGSLCISAIVMCTFSAGQNVESPRAMLERRAIQPPRPVAIANGKVALTPQNTTIQFVGTHTGDEPNPRTGYFTKFTGELAIDEASKTLLSGHAGYRHRFACHRNRPSYASFAQRRFL